ncbi:MAG: FG-GAP repeat domain-containing protein [Acidimicrobiales bacterium]
MYRSLRRALALGAVFATLSGGPAAAAPPVSFAPVAHYATGGTGGSGWHETGSAAADFDNDGDADVAVADYFASNSFRIMLNRGDGTFTSPGVRNTVQYGVGTLVAGDVNEDGRADLIATNAFQVFVLRGNGNGTFTVGATYTVPQGGQEDAHVADFDDDGHLDVAVLTRFGVQLLLGDGNGTFATGPISPLPSLGGSGIDDADLNGDGALDVVVSDGIAQVVYALVGDGNGGFSLSGVGEAAGVAGTVLAGDLDGDGFDDVVALTEFTGAFNGVVLLNDGAGGFGIGTRYDAGLGPVSGELADLNGDGILDIVSSDTVASTQVVLAGNGDGTFANAGSFPVSQFPQTPVVADFDRDGRTDIAVAGVQGSGTTLLSVIRNVS